LRLFCALFNNLQISGVSSISISFWRSSLPHLIAYLFFWISLRREGAFYGYRHYDWTFEKSRKEARRKLTKKRN
jgi:hypothetical protein